MAQLRGDDELTALGTASRHGASGRERALQPHGVTITCKEKVEETWAPVEVKLGCLVFRSFFFSFSFNRCVVVNIGRFNGASVVS